MPHSRITPRGPPMEHRLYSERGARLYVMNADGSNPHNISAPDAIEDRWPSWSPDGTKLAFARKTAVGTDIWSANVDGSGLTNLTGPGNYDDSPSWQAI